MLKIHITSISRRLKNLREEQKLTQEELAEQLGISRQSIISVEKGKCLPSLPLALRMADLFKTTIDNFFLSEDNGNPRQKGGEKTMPRFITPFSPIRDLDRFFEDEDLTPSFPRWRGFQFPMVNVSQSDNSVIVIADIPGIKEDDINIEVGDDFVDISGERKEESKKEEEGFFHQEVRYGSFSRRIPLPAEVKADKADATIKDGQLKLVIPKLEPEKPKVTKVKVKKS